MISKIIGLIAVAIVSHFSFSLYQGLTSQQ